MAVKSSPDWFARGTALVAILLSVIGLWLAYRNYSWQMKTYREGLEERILVRLGTSRTVKDRESFSLTRNGDVGVEVVNIGTHPIYIKKVEIQVPDRRLFSFYEHNPSRPNERMKLLEHGEAANYSMKWDFSEYPLQEWLEAETPPDNLWLDVETTKQTFRQHPTLRWASISTALKKRSAAGNAP